jgi:hypothetical protein
MVDVRHRLAGSVTAWLEGHLQKEAALPGPLERVGVVGDKSEGAGFRLGLEKGKGVTLNRVQPGEYPILADLIQEQSRQGQTPEQNAIRTIRHGLSSCY